MDIIQNIINRIDQKFRPKLEFTDAQLLDFDGAINHIFPKENYEQIYFYEEIENIKNQLKNDIDFPSTSDLTLINLIYTTIRVLCPIHVIETGVWIGSSSLAILTALELNNNANSRLYSIDLPPLRSRNRIQVGRVVPERLRIQWELFIGSSATILPELLKSMQQLDVFIHDSDHTYRNILLELRTVWPYLRKDAIMILDDAHTNRAVIDFAESVNQEVVLIKREKGGCIAVIKKT